MLKGAIGNGGSHGLDAQGQGWYCAICKCVCQSGPPILSHAEKSPLPASDVKPRLGLGAGGSFTLP